MHLHLLKPLRLKFALALLACLSFTDLASAQTGEVAPVVRPWYYYFYNETRYNEANDWDIFNCQYHGWYGDDNDFLGASKIVETSIWFRGTNSFQTNETWRYYLDDRPAFLLMTPEGKAQYLDEGNYHEASVLDDAPAQVPSNNPWWWKYLVGWADYMHAVPQIQQKDTKLEIVTGGFTNSQASSVFKLTVAVTHYTTVDPETGALLDPLAVPDTDITVLGKNPTNGIIYIVLQDNTTNQNVTPVIPATYSNIAFSVQAERVKMPIGFIATNILTQADSGNGGIVQNVRDNIATSFGTNLFQITIHANQTVGLYDLIETASIVPQDFPYTNNYAWHRDVYSHVWIWINDPAYTNSLFEVDSPSSHDFSGNPFNPSGGGNDGVSAGDNTPDVNRAMYLLDAPNLGLSGVAQAPSHPDAEIDIANLPVGSVMARRFSAREWVTWDGGVASIIFKWHMHITLRKTATGWQLRGLNQANTGESQLGFTIEDAQGISSGP